MKVEVAPITFVALNLINLIAYPIVFYELVLKTTHHMRTSHENCRFREYVNVESLRRIYRKGKCFNTFSFLSTFTFLKKYIKSKQMTSPAKKFGLTCAVPHSPTSNKVLQKNFQLQVLQNFPIL